ncbi:MAG TPA: glycosyltransferase family 4 protein [Solirubrobacteraceae bacterium]|nr:glycosyltransferase family 4 protein [Solirubrobacteraceae bacterium]
MSVTIETLHHHQAPAAAPPRRKLRIALLAPPWIPVPPPGYGGIEAVVAPLADELVRRGHDVTLFAAPGSRSSARVRALLDRAHPDEIGSALHEVDHVTRAFAEIDAAAELGRPFDIVHDHCGFVAFALADRLATPLVHTLHGPFTAQTSVFYEHHAHKAPVVAISRTQLESAPSGLRVAGVVPNPIDADCWPLVRHKEDYLLWVGRMTEEKGPHRAIAAARHAGMRLILAGPVQPGQEPFFEREVAPQIDGDRVTYVGEVAGERKVNLFARARALLMPIRWPEPFGMVMLEAMVCGTPVIAFPEGAARELVIDGVTGLLVDDEREMARACERLGGIDPIRCRQSVVDRCDVRCVARSYERVYLEVAAQAAHGRRAHAALGPAWSERSAHRARAAERLAAGGRPRSRLGAVQ